MTKINIPLDQWAKIPHDIWDSHWFLLSAGDYSKDEFNTMTISWGSFGTIWNRPFAMVVVRPQRYTFQFMEKYDDFSLCAFPTKFQPTLNLLGTISGRDNDKIKESGLSVQPSKIIKAPVFNEAILQIECKKIYWDDLNPDHFIAKYIPRQYPMKDYHRMYFGEIVAIETDSSFFNS
ncbi:MAG: flavin reductase [Chloroflexi bacterium HGW-Chloroflexi-8]|nr:MAG: flavin reductase [Chloroflexi bacterium HGW-Chloroflexi-8]